MERMISDDGREYFLNDDGALDGWGMVLDPPIETDNPERFVQAFAKTFNE